MMNYLPQVDQRHNTRSVNNNTGYLVNPELHRAFPGQLQQEREQDEVTRDLTFLNHDPVDLSIATGNELINHQNPPTSTMNLNQLPLHSYPTDSTAIHQYHDFIDPYNNYCTIPPVSYQNVPPNLGSSTIPYTNQQNMTVPHPDLQPPSPQQLGNNDPSFPPLHPLRDSTVPNLASPVFFTPWSSRNSRLVDGDNHHPPNLDMIPDIPDTCFNYITDLLREDNADENPSTLHEIMAFQNCYKSFSGALSQSNPGTSSFGQYQHRDHNNNEHSRCVTAFNNREVGGVNNSSHGSNSGPTTTLNDLVENENENSSAADVALGGLESTLLQFPLLRGALLPASGTSSFYTAAAGATTAAANTQVKFDWVHEASKFIPNSSGFAPLSQPAGETTGLGKTHQLISVVHEDQSQHLPADNYRKGIRKQDRGEQEEGVSRRNKQIVTGTHETYDQIAEYEDNLFCPEGRRGGQLMNKNGTEFPKPTSKTRGKNNKTNVDKTKKQQQGSRKKKNDHQLVDLRDLLARCAQAIARVDLTAATELLQEIRQHSSPYGDSMQRIAHYLANALEARLAGNCTSSLTTLHAPPDVHVSEILKANRIYVGAVPFMIMSYYITNKTIAILSSSASRIHIIDFGIYLGLQWPCIINNLSRRESGGGPPRLKITGIDFPQPGLRPSQRLEETGRCLTRYAQRFNLPFEYNTVAKQWEEVKLEDLNIDHGNEMVIVNCLYRSQHLHDESVDENSSRSAFLNLVKDIKPEYFLHGVVNGLHGAPFFITRFREAMNHYLSLFDLFEATMPREDEERMLLESKVYGKEAFNVIACEGVERVERPETYKRWQVRKERIGLKQMMLDEELLRRAKRMVRKSFREEFVLDEDGRWAVQGWKGRILFAISCWKTE